MADDDINITISADDQASSKLKAIGENAKKTGEAGRLGFFALGEAAENAAQKMGVPNQVSRQLGNSVERLSSSLGAAGIALGAVGLAASSAYLIWKNYREEQVRIREEKIKSGQMAGTWIEGILKEAANTRELVAAKKEQAKVEFDANKLRLEQALPAMRELLAEKLARQEELLTTSKAYDNLWAGTGARTKKMAEEIGREVKKLASDLRVAEEEYRLFSAKNRMKVGESKGGKSIEETAAEQNARVITEIEHRKNLSILALRDQLAADNIVRYNEERRLNEMRVSAGIDMASNISQTFQLMSQQNTAHARKWFTIYKLSAAGETAMTTARAAMAAFAPPPLGLGPVWGGALAATITALGAAKINMIRGQTFEGGGGVGAGAVGTFPANSATGLPSGSGSSGGVNLTLVINGESKNIGRLTEDIVKELYRNNGSIGNLSVAVGTVG